MDRYVSNDKSSPPKNFRSNRSIEKLHDTNFRVIEVVIRCGLDVNGVMNGTPKRPSIRS